MTGGPGLPMDEARYSRLTGEAWRRILDAFEEVDPDVAEADVAGDTLAILLRSGVKIVINTQRPTRQIWLAAKTRAWHFSYDEPTGRWLDDKGTGAELFATIGQVVGDLSGAAVTV